MIIAMKSFLYFTYVTYIIPNFKNLVFGFVLLPRVNHKFLNNYYFTFSPPPFWGGSHRTLSPERGD